MTGLIIAFILIVLIIILLLSSLSVTLNFADKADFKVSYLGIKLYDISSVKKKKKSSKKVKKKEEKDSFTKLLKEYTTNKNRKEIVFDILSLLKDLLNKFAKLIQHINIKKLDFDLIIASDDAAKTAILYGNACSIIYSLTALLKSACDFDHKKIKVSADFSSENISFKMTSKIKIKLIYILKFAISVALSVIKIRLGEVKNGRTQH